jgi:hypothetical protein
MQRFVAMQTNPCLGVSTAIKNRDSDHQSIVSTRCVRSVETPKYAYLVVQGIDIGFLLEA